MSHRLRRLRLLELRLQSSGQRCPICRDWESVPIVCVDLNGRETSRSEPSVCPQCGREIALRSELQLVGIAEEDLP